MRSSENTNRPENADKPKRARLWPALRLKCPYCGQTPLLRRGSWFVFDDGCQRCDYSFERENGYYTGASWLVNFPMIGLTGFALAAVLLYFMQDADPLVIALITSIYMISFGAWFTPFSMAIWLYGEHRLHPRDHEDRYQANRSL